MRSSLSCGVIEHSRYMDPLISIVVRNGYFGVLMFNFHLYMRIDPIPGVLDDSSTPGVSTIWNTNCQLLLPEDSTAIRCSA